MVDRNYISQRGNPFNTKNQGIENLAAVALVDKKASQFLLNVIPTGERAYAEFRKGTLEEKSVQLLKIFLIVYQQNHQSKRKKRYIKRNSSFHTKY